MTTAALTAPACRSLRDSVEVWGTVVTIDLRDVDSTWPAEDAIAAALGEATAHLHRIDRVFSTCRPDSLVSRYRSGELSRAELESSAEDDDVALLLTVIEACERGRELTEGAFDPWAVDGGFDPSGDVKGWAAQTVADRLVTHGLRHVCVNAAGDLTVRGLADVGTAWRVGVPHPEDRLTLVHSFDLTDGAAATSGFSERGEHIVVPSSGPSIPPTSSRTSASSSIGEPRWTGHGARQTTVWGPDAGWCEILSTGLMVAGRCGLDWFAQLPGYRAFCVDATENRVFRMG